MESFDCIWLKDVAREIRAEVLGMNELELEIGLELGSGTLCILCCRWLFGAWMTCYCRTRLICDSF